MRTTGRQIDPDIVGSSVFCRGDRGAGVPAAANSLGTREGKAVEPLLIYAG